MAYPPAGHGAPVGYPQQHPPQGFPTQGFPTQGFPRPSAAPGPAALPPGYAPAPGYRPQPGIQPPYYQAPPPPKKSSGLGIVLGICGVLLLGLLGLTVGCGAMVLTARTSTSGVTSPGSQPKVEYTPGSKPTESFSRPQPDTGRGEPPIADDVIANNPLNKISNPRTDCGSRGPFGDKAAFEGYVTETLHCLATAWRPAMASVGLPYTEPELVFYYSSIQTPCGSAARTQGAFYCGGNHSIYFSQVELDERNEWLYTTMVIIHEHAHALQHEAGYHSYRGQMTSQEGRDQVQRRFELQAACFEVTGGRAMPPLRFTAADMEKAYNGWSGDLTHGTKANGQIWRTAGWYATTQAACNTWTADKQYLQ